MTKRTLWLAIPWAAFAVLAIGWVIHWHIVAGAAEQRIRAWVAERNAQGARVSIARIVRHGFPAMLRLELREIDYADLRGGWRAATPRADLHIQPFNTEHVILRARAPITVTRDNGAVTHVAADALIASFRTRRGALAQAGVEADNLTLDDPDQEGVFAAQKLVINLRPDPRADVDYQIAVEARNITLPRPVRSLESFGIEAPLLRAAIVAEHGAALLQAAPDDPLGPWRAANGRLRFETLALNWGPLEATGRGWGALDDERRIEGALEFPIARPAPVVSAIANGENVSADARRALALLAAGFELTRERVTLEASASDGALRLQGVPVRLLPPVY